MARMKETRSQYTLDVPTNAESLGRLLGETKLDMKRIGLDVLLHVLISALAVWIWHGDGPMGHLDVILYIGLAVFTLYPLIHMGDSMKFYENGVTYKKNTCLFRTNQVLWIKNEGVGHIIAGKYLSLGGYPKSMNASYLSAPCETFERAYGDVLR